ncbi:sensor histidine kinase [Arabiibacter massiliensis]|uniref:sensor histidine kinase n=1 Tax=Arabiibacter massiliensis TaxID=1870985 RepID=UPI0009BC3B5B|nr:ATP-binding protein [Arabiibacter massiliensis]
MSERTLIRRELARQTALLFVVFALLFSLLGAGIYSMVSASIYRTADASLRELQAGGGSVTADKPASSSVDGDPDPGGAEDAASLTVTIAQQDIVEANPQIITLLRDEDGALVDTVGLYERYPAYLAELPFDANDLGNIRQTSAGGHTYRTIAYASGEDGGAAFMQALVNVDAELAILDGFTRTLVIYLAVAVAASAAASYLLSRRMLKPIVANWQAQTEFVQNASHELRTPLAVIQATGELLLDHPGERIVDRFEDVNVITTETKRLSRLVDDLMALSLDDAGRAEPALGAVDVDALVRDMADAYRDLAEAQGKRLHAEAAFDGTVQADADKLRQLLGILLDNALKYTEAGDEVRLSTRAEGARCIIEVADIGCGIDPAECERVFERFYRADKARSRETGGHGLGLSLAKGIVEAHGGTIMLKANEPRGTVAVVTLRPLPS